MKVKLLTTISFFTYQLSISQTEKVLQGKVISQELLLKNVEVINKTAQTSTRTNELGEFSILAKEQDSLLFFSKDYLFTRLKLTLKDLEKNYFIVEMTPKAEELENVVVSRAVFTKTELKKIANDREEINKIKIRKQFDDVTTNVTVYDGKIKNAINFTYPIFDKPKKKIEPHENRFKKLVIASCPPDFFVKNLKLKPEEKELFLNFCDVDPKSKILLEHPNVLATMDFLYAKNEEFKKLK
ncbi:hypothetical protein SAMN05444397_10646 [Flavobacterium aquidurense]|uniref:CarboxypepD_reg-like domain-containing protein n=1 Tax=Flavobacterium frigidimaris TaxID=262320 RepID=A0ABX4BSN3_FLAFR|nr:hypothetical protein [Flavobacterium frigidimaris]OXA79829.1 hypothetical protein B0A65_07715 [Flavobacterium frigidimaris]SDZ38656.1 hypothetical protein SAMN05444397_10646 [Flavobacterium aquidurense]